MSLSSIESILHVSDKSSWVEADSIQSKRQSEGKRSRASTASLTLQPGSDACSITFISGDSIDRIPPGGKRAAAFH